MNTNRINELVASIRSFDKTTYHKAEVLPELLSLQRELVMATPWDDATDENDLKLYAVVNRLAELNTRYNGVADMELDYFIEGADRVCREITKLARGGSGKAKVMTTLHDLCCPRRVLRNISMGDDSERTEIDALVITEKAYFILEVKNTRRDVYIDTMGNYFRCSLDYHWDTQIAEKMHTREYFLRKALHTVGEHNPNIVNVVVFTEDIQVNNRCRKLKTCSLKTLVSLIEGYSGYDLYSMSDMKKGAAAVLQANQTEVYPTELGIQQVKLGFATVIAALEEAQATQLMAA